VQAGLTPLATLARSVELNVAAIGNAQPSIVSSTVYNNLSLMKSGRRHCTTQDNTFVRSTMDWRNTVPLRSDLRRRVILPKRIRYTGEPIDCESLHRKQDHCDLDNEEFVGLRNDTERDNERRRSRRGMAYP
jgi:hypothetical protein